MNIQQKHYMCQAFSLKMGKKIEKSVILGDKSKLF